MRLFGKTSIRLSLSATLLSVAWTVTGCTESKESVSQYFDTWQRAATDKLLDAAAGDELERTLQTEIEESGDRRK